MANIAIFRINYKSDFILTLNSDAGWMTPFCIKFWTGAPSQAYFVGYDGTTYTHCAPVAGDPTKLAVQFDDHHLPIGDLKFQIGYHFTVADFPTTVEDEVINQAAVIIDQDGTPMQVMLDLNGETAPEIEFSLPAYANEAQRIANEQQRIAAETQRIANEDTRIQYEESRIAAEETRQQNEQQRINQEQARVNEYASLKADAVAATGAANDAAALANQKAQLAADKAALAQAAADLANAKAQLATDKAALAASAAQLANDKAALAQQKAEYAQTQGGYAKDQGDYAKKQGDYAKEQGDTALADHQRAEEDHGIAVNDHTQAGNDHTRAESDHTRAGNDHTRAESDHGIAVDDHTQAGNDHTRAESDHGIAADDHTQAGNDHTRAESDHTRAESDHAAVEVYVDSLGVFDLSKHNAVGGVLATYANLDAALTALNALESKYKYGGMSFKFVQSSDNKYVQYRLMSDTFNTTPANWQGVDIEPIANSHNLAESGGVFKVKEQALQNTSDISELTSLTPYETVTGYRCRPNSNTGLAELVEYSEGIVIKYNVVAGNKYTFSGKYGLTTNIYVYIWVDANGIATNGEYKGTIYQEDIWEDVAITTPEGATELWMNVQSYNINYFNFKSVGNTIKSRDLQQQVQQNTEDIAQNTADISEATLLAPDSTLDNSWINAVGETKSNNNYKAEKYLVEAGKTYLFSGQYGSGTTALVYFVVWFDANDNYLGHADYHSNGSTIVRYIDKPVVAPENAAYAYLNINKHLSSYFNFKELDGVIKTRDLRLELQEQITQNYENIDKNISDINEIRVALTKVESTLLTPYETVTGYRCRPNSSTGIVELTSYSGGSVRKYNVTSGKKYSFSGYYHSTITIVLFYWIDFNNIATASDYKGTSGQVDDWNDIQIIVPEGITEIWMNIVNSDAEEFDLKSITEELVDVPQLDEQVQQNTSDIEILKESVEKSMKIVITGNELAEDIPFYIRTKYNNDKDIIITHRINLNLLITFKETFIGPNTLTDNQLMTSSYNVSSHGDSTSPLRTYTQYWHLFAQHGYPVPYFANSIGMTSADVGALWKDQLDREFHIGKVTTEYVWLLPIIYQDANGHYTRDWNSKATSADITNLTYVSGGSTGKYTSPISLSTYLQEQLRPIMKVTDRTWVVDGIEVTEPGTYYCNEFCVNETETGYDPATISDWFGGEDGKPNLNGAQVHAIFTYSYNYKGAQCAVYTTIHLLREAKGYYGGTQQQFFYDKGDYKAMFMIPKSATRNGVELDKPFNSPSSSSTGYTIYRTASHLKDIDDPVDRQIGMLHNPTNDTYLVGMAAGLSLIKGDTIKNKRNQICLEDSLLLSFSPGNTNKFYVSGINTSAFASEYYPAGYFKEIDYYVSYFDPSENVGQVYWYKDGSKYVIYCHCQSIQNVLSINVPAFMDGLKLSVVEKTNSTELLSDTIANGKFFVNYNTADANYIVLIAE